MNYATLRNLTNAELLRTFDRDDSDVVRTLCERLEKEHELSNDVDAVEVELESTQDDLKNALEEMVALESQITALKAGITKAVQAIRLEAGPSSELREIADNLEALL